MRKPSFVIFVGNDKKFEFKLKTANGDDILYGPGFRSKSEAVHAVSGVMSHGATTARYVQRERVDGKFYFQLKSPIGRLLGWSKEYETRQAMLTAIRIARVSTKTAQVIDLVIA